MTVLDLLRYKPSRLAFVPISRYYYVKRVVDLAICLVLLPFLLVLMGMVALAIVLDSPGAPIFVQERIGRSNLPFRIYKFRTMRRDHDAGADKEFMQAYIAGNPAQVQGESEQPLFKPPNRNNYTRLGKYLRKTSLDELPQIFNVLRGQMSLIGPRPNVPYEVDKYNCWHMERLTVLPGITGLAQVRGRSSISFDTIVRYDIYYVRNYSLELDIKIVWWTILGILFGKGAG